MFLGARIIKTAIAASGAVGIAEALSLPFATSAGILAILGVQPTRRKTVRQVSSRFLACILGLFIGAVLFTFFRYHPGSSV